MTVQTFRDLLAQRPFKPFRLVMSSGQAYEVRHPEMAMVGLREVIIAVDVSPDRPARRLAWCDPVHVVRIERLKDEPSTESTGGS